MRRGIVVAVLLLSALFAVFPVCAQTPKIKKGDTVIYGTVIGADGKAVPAAAVTCGSSAGIRSRIVHTDSKGHYLIVGLKQDSYDLRASANGAYSDWEKNIPLRKGQSKEITLHLLNGNTAISGKLPSKANK